MRQTTPTSGSPYWNGKPTSQDDPELAARHGGGRRMPRDRADNRHLEHAPVGALGHERTGDDEFRRCWP